VQVTTKRVASSEESLNVGIGEDLESCICQQIYLVLATGIGKASVHWWTTEDLVIRHFDPIGSTTPRHRGCATDCNDRQPGRR
jgi:hypothetical protein